MFLDPVRPEDATGELADLYHSEQERWGFLPTFTQVFSHMPEAYRAWLGLIRVAYESMDRRRCELATLAAARELRSTCCSVAHGMFLRDLFYDSEQVAKIARDHHQAGLSPADVAIMDFAAKAAADPSSVTQMDVDSLRAHGLSDREIFEIAYAVAARAFFATLIESLGTRAESPMVESLGDDLLEALTVGRPAADA